MKLDIASFYLFKQVKAWVEAIPPVYPEVVPATTSVNLADQQTMASSDIVTENHPYVYVEPETTIPPIIIVTKPHKIRHDKNKKGRGKKKGKTTTTTTTTTAATTTTTTFSTTTAEATSTSATIEEASVENAEENDVALYEPGEEHDTGTTKSESPLDPATAQVPPTEPVTRSELESETTAPTETGQDEDEEEDYELVTDKPLENVDIIVETVTSTTSSPTVKPTSRTTVKPGTTTTRKPRSSTTRRPTRIHKPPDGSTDCSSFSDISCFELQESGKELNPCCFKGVYLTGVCTRELCSSKTYHLCCFQKYQQVMINIYCN